VLLGLLEFLLLHLRGGVQKEFQDQGAVSHQCVLHLGDVAKPDGELRLVDLSFGAQTCRPHQAADEE